MTDLTAKQLDALRTLDGHGNTLRGLGRKGLLVLSADNPTNTSQWALTDLGRDVLAAHELEDRLAVLAHRYPNVDASSWIYLWRAD